MDVIPMTASLLPDHQPSGTSIVIEQAEVDKPLENKLFLDRMRLFFK